MSDLPIDVAELSSAHLDAWAKLFEACSSACFCRYWHFTGDKNAWLMRSATAGGDNNLEQIRDVHAREDRARGLLALTDDKTRCIGWMKLTPRASVPKLRALPVYRKLDLGDDDGVYSIGCMLIDPQFRKRGVARALISNAAKFVKAWGGKTIEAYPRHSTEKLHAEEVWMGPESTFAANGFQFVAGENPYPVYRLVL